MTASLFPSDQAKVGALQAGMQILQEENGRLEGEKADLIAYVFSLFQQLHDLSPADTPAEGDSFLSQRLRHWQEVLLQEARECGKTLAELPEDDPQRRDLEHYASWLASLHNRLMPTITKTDLTHPPSTDSPVSPR